MNLAVLDNKKQNVKFEKKRLTGKKEGIAGYTDIHIYIFVYTSLFDI